MKIFYSIFLSILFMIILGMAKGRVEAAGKDYNPDLTIPKKFTSLNNGEQTLTRETLLANPQLIILANRDAFEIIKETAKVFTYPTDTVWVPNIALAPGWVTRAFIKPSLKKTAKKYNEQGIKVIYDFDGEWGKGLKVTSEEDDFITVFYADTEGVVKVMEKIITAKAYKSDEQKISLGEEIIAAWSAVK